MYCVFIYTTFFFLNRKAIFNLHVIQTCNFHRTNSSAAIQYKNKCSMRKETKDVGLLLGSFTDTWGKCRTFSSRQECSFLLSCLFLWISLSVVAVRRPKHIDYKSISNSANQNSRVVGWQLNNEPMGQWKALGRFNGATDKAVSCLAVYRPLLNSRNVFETIFILEKHDHSTLAK